MAVTAISFFGATATVGILALTSLASSPKISNYGFESNSIAKGTMSGKHRGWTQYGKVGEAFTWNPMSVSFGGVNGADCLPSPAEGRQCLWLTGKVNIYQVYSYFKFIEADKIYTLTAAVGAPLDCDFGDFSLVLASSAGEIISNGDADGITNRSGLFYDRSVTFNTGPEGRRDVIGKMLILNLNGDRAAIDNVRLGIAPFSEINTPSALPTEDNTPDYSLFWPAACFSVFMAIILLIWMRRRFFGNR